MPKALRSRQPYLTRRSIPKVEAMGLLQKPLVNCCLVLASCSRTILVWPSDWTMMKKKVRKFINIRNVQQQHVAARYQAFGNTAQKTNNNNNNKKHGFSDEFCLFFPSDFGIYDNTLFLNSSTGLPIFIICNSSFMNICSCRCVTNHAWCMKQIIWCVSTFIFLLCIFVHKISCSIYTTCACPILHRMAYARND